MRSYWTVELFRLGLLLGIALVVGIGFKVPGLLLWLALLAYILIHLWRLNLLEQRLGQGRRSAPDDDRTGMWGAIELHIHELGRRDLRRRRRAAQLMRAFREATSAMPDAVVALDHAWGIRWSNPAALELIGVQFPRDNGQHIGNLLRSPAFAAALAADGPREPIEIASPRNPERWLTLFMVEYGDRQRLLFARDTTRMRRLEQMRREFVANASHELRSPLTVIGGYLDAMNEDLALHQGWSGPLLEMRRQSDRMAGIVDDLLELSRLETEAEEPPHDPVDVRGLLARIRDEALALGEGPRDIELAFSTDARLLGSERELYSAFSNLVFNAMRYTGVEGQVTVAWTLEQGHPTLQIRDTGVGIPPEHLPRLTERFYRVDPSRARTKGGTGLGLAIVKHVVQRHGAQLRIESVVGQGSCFTLRFPPGRAAILDPL